MSTPLGYSRLQIGLHWAIALLIAYQFLFHDGMEAAYEAVLRGQEIVGNGGQIHALIGIAVFALVLLRVIVRWRRGAPAAPAGGSALQDKLAKGLHMALYGLMILIPASGMAAWGGGIKPAADVHEILLKLLMASVLLHSLAALYHQYVLKDGLIRRMMKSG